MWEIVISCVMIEPSTTHPEIEMNQAKIQQLKSVLDAATAAYEEKRDELIAAGFKSKDRYGMLKSLKANQDSANAAYNKYAKGQINMALCKIIAADKKATPQQKAKNWATSYARQQLQTAVA